MKALLLFLVLIAVPAHAQLVSPLELPGGVDTTARTAAQTALDAANAACVPMAVIPPAEVPGGSAGSGQNCRLVNAVDNRISRTSVFSYGTDGRVLCGGSTTCTWATPLPAGSASYPVLYTPLGRAASCSVASSTNTGFTGMVCTQPTVAIVLAGSSVITAGLTAGQVFVLSLPSTQASQ